MSSGDSNTIQNHAQFIWSVADLLRGNIVVQLEYLHRRIEAHSQRDRLHRLAEQSIDFLGNCRARLIGVGSKDVIARSRLG